LPGHCAPQTASSEADGDILVLVRPCLPVDDDHESNKETDDNADTTADKDHNERVIGGVFNIDNQL
jgi:hypothetical protein